MTWRGVAWRGVAWCSCTRPNPTMPLYTNPPLTLRQPHATPGEEAIHIGSAAALAFDDPVYAQYREAGVIMWRGFSKQQVDACRVV